MLAAQNGKFHIDGTTKATPKKVYLVYNRIGGVGLDSTSVAGGKFAFGGEVSGMTAAVIYFDHDGAGLPKRYNFVGKDALQFLLGEESIKVTCEDKVQDAKITHSPLNDDNKVLMAAMKPVNDRRQEVYMAFDKLPKEEQTDQKRGEAIKQLSALEKEGQQVAKVFIENHPASLVSLNAIAQLMEGEWTVAEISEIFNNLNTKVKESKNGKEIKSKIDQAAKTEVGAEAPDFTQNTPDGKPVSLKDYRGKYVLVDFWASWCGPCRGENPHVVAAFNKFKDKNFDILGVSLDDNKDKWLAAIEKDGLTWTHISDLKGWGNEAAAAYGVRGIPANYLIGPDGKIIAKNLRGADLEAKLTEVLK